MSRIKSGASRLSQEPFVSGIPEMIDTLVSDLSNAERDFRLLFSAAAFPGFQVKLEKVRAAAACLYLKAEALRVREERAIMILAKDVSAER